MDGLSTRGKEQLQSLSLHWTKMRSLWIQFVSANTKQFNRTIQSSLRLAESQCKLVEDGLNLQPHFLEYLIDATERNILFWDVLRKRGNHYLEHVAAGQPPVLIFSYQLLMDGRKFEKPVNYGLVEIIPPEGVSVDSSKRPYVIVDPRAGHGS